MVVVFLIIFNAIALMFYLMEGNIDRANFHLIIVSYLLLDSKTVNIKLVAREEENENL